MTILGCVAPLLLAAMPAGDTGTRLLDGTLQLTEISHRAEQPRGAPDLTLPSSRAFTRLVALSGPEDRETSGQGAPEQQTAPPPSGSLDFNLLGPPPKSHQVDEHALQLRRTMLTWHQGVGLGMFALQLATTIVGQLNYDDKFGGNNTGKYVQPHAILAFSTLAAFAATAGLALLAPKPAEPHEGFDRVSLHKLAMFTAAAGMVAQGVLGVWTQSREGYLNQQTVGTAHLVVGYVTLAAVMTGIGALVF